MQSWIEDTRSQAASQAHLEDEHHHHELEKFQEFEETLDVKPPSVLSSTLSFNNNPSSFTTLPDFSGPESWTRALSRVSNQTDYNCGNDDLNSIVSINTEDMSSFGTKARGASASRGRGSASTRRGAGRPALKPLTAAAASMQQKMEELKLRNSREQSERTKSTSLQNKNTFLDE